MRKVRMKWIEDEDEDEDGDGVGRGRKEDKRRKIYPMVGHLWMRAGVDGYERDINQRGGGGE